MSRSSPGSAPTEAQALGLPLGEGPTRLTWTLWPAANPHQKQVAVEEALRLTRDEGGDSE